MRIILLTQWYPPEPQKILSDLAGSLQNAGHEVTVLTGFPNYPEGKIYPGYRMRPLQREVLEGIPVLRIPIYPDHSSRAVKRSLNYLSFAASAAFIGPWVAPRADLIYVVGNPPLGAGAAFLGRILRMPFVVEIQDIWPESLLSTSMVRNRMALGAVDRLAKFVYRRAAAIRVISPGFRRNLIAKGVPDEKISVISNWVDTDFYRPLPPDEKRAAEFGFAGRFNILFAGMMGAAQGLENVILAAEELRDLPEVQFVFLGDGTAFESLRSMTVEKKLENVRFLGRHPQKSMPDFFALADAMLLNLTADPLFEITIPHKIYAYMSSGKPILGALAGDPADVVTSSQAGFVSPPGDPRALAQIVRRLYSMTIEDRRRLGENGRTAVLERFGRTTIVRQIAGMLENVLERQRK